MGVHYNLKCYVHRQDGHIRGRRTEILAELMNSPKSHASQKRGEKKESRRRASHNNKKFYNSKAWRETREAYMRHYRSRLFNEIPTGKWQQIDLSMHQVSYILQLEYLPCEICLKLYCAEAYQEVEEGKELDHIQPLNRENAIESQGYGDPFSFDNLQLLCRTHHSKKSQRER